MKTFVDLEANTNEPKDIFLYIPEPEALNVYMYNDKYYYANNNYMGKHIHKEINNENKYIIDIMNKNNTDESFYNDKEYYLLFFEEPMVPSHNYHFIVSYLKTYNLYKQKNIPYLILNTNDKYYNQLINFLKTKILLDCQFDYIKTNIIYKIKKIHIIKYLQKNLDYDNSKAYSEYTNILKTLFCKNKLKNKKIYNIKSNSNNQFCWTKDRSFIFDKTIRDILYKYEYDELPLDNEISKQQILQNSKYGILSWGGNMHINIDICSYNQQKSFLILCHESYEHEYKNIFPDKNINIFDTTRYGNYVRYIRNIDFNSFDQIISDFEYKYIYNTL